MSWWILALSAHAVEWLDGADTDGDELIPLLELDCDDDGAFALPPVVPDPLVALTPAAYGLVDCHDVPVTGALAVSCFGASLQLVCADDGLWSAWTPELVRLGAMEGGVRVGRTRNPACDGWDCDDTCAARCEGEIERCDGIDGDCDDPLVEPDLDGLPDPMHAFHPKPGRVPLAEADLDGDDTVTCEFGDVLDGAGAARSDLGCGTRVRVGTDCNDACALIHPFAPELCDGFPLDNACSGAPPDTLAVDAADGDRHRACGYKGVPEDPLSTETLFVLVLSDQGAPAVPLLTPRAAACDAPLAEALAALDLSDGAFLERCIGADTCARARVEGTTPDWPADCDAVIGQTCTVVRVEVPPGLWETPDRCDALGVPEQGAFRTVWPRGRIVAARRLVTDWECYRAYGTFGCDREAPAGWRTPYPGPPPSGGHFGSGAFISMDPAFALEVGRFVWWSGSPSLAGCWTTADGTDDRATGGDCDPTSGDVHRDALEGPADPVALVYGHDPGCRACRDGVDNDCDGLVDRDDAGCAPCDGLSCGTAPAEPPMWVLVAPLIGLLRRRTRRATRTRTGG